MSDQPGILRFGVFEVHLAAGEVRKNGSRVKLQGQPFQLLVTLLKRPGEIVTREELKEKLWAGDTFVDFDHSLSTAVNKIREALGDSASSPRFIETVPRRGYRFIGGAEGTAAVQAAQGAAMEASRGLALTGARKGARWIGVLAGVAAAALVGFVIAEQRPRRTPQSVPNQPIPLTSLPGSELSPTFSPDGSQVAFAWNGENQDNLDIYVQAVGSPRPLRLTTDPAEDGWPAWSPDGRQIAFLRLTPERQAIYLMPPLGGPERRIAELALSAKCHGQVAWSPDGKFLVFSRSESERSPPSIYVLSLDTGQERRLTSPPALMIYGDTGPAVSPDGRTVAFARGDSLKVEIYLVPWNGGDPRQLTSQGGINWWPAWTPGGREIVYERERAFGSLLQLWRVAVSGGEPRQITEVGEGVRKPAVSPQARRLAYVRGSDEHNIWRYSMPGRPDGDPPKMVIGSTRRDHRPQLSPDGNRIAFDSDRTGSREIWVCNSDGSNLMQLTSWPRGFPGCPRWSPDSRHIAFDAAPEGNWDVFVTDSAGGSPQALTKHPAADARPSWSQDGRWVYFASDRTGADEIWKTPAEGGDPIQVTRNGGFQPLEFGGYLYFAKSFYGAGLWRVLLNGGQEAVVLADLSQAGFGFWDVTKNGIHFLEERVDPPRPSKWFLRLARHEGTEAVDVMEVPPPGHLIALDISPDGESFLYSQRDQTGSDLIMLENFE